MTDTELKNTEDTAGFFFSPEETAIICEFPDSFLDREDFQRAYKKGRLKRELALRKSVIELAVSGSSPAQVLAVQMLEKSKLDTIRT
ncbi:MAG: hypothetical protein V4608_03340 [Bacteroidota bacterium]